MQSLPRGISTSQNSSYSADAGFRGDFSSQMLSYLPDSLRMPNPPNYLCTYSYCVHKFKLVNGSGRTRVSCEDGMWFNDFLTRSKSVTARTVNFCKVIKGTSLFYSHWRQRMVGSWVGWFLSMSEFAVVKVQVRLSYIIFFCKFLKGTT